MIGGALREVSRCRIDVQAIIAKYGLAAHLAIVAVAPLFLSPFGCRAGGFVVVSCLSAFALCWMMMDPSVRHGEMLHDARSRVTRNVLRDPLFWIMLTIAVFAGLRAFNSGIGMRYDAELGEWSIAPAFARNFVGSVGDAGFESFFIALALVVLLPACCHALGHSARQAYLFVMSVLSGVVSAALLMFAWNGEIGVLSLAKCSLESSSFVGMSFAVNLFAGTITLTESFVGKWHWTVFLSPLSIAANAAGAYVFSPAYAVVLFSAIELLIIGYVMFFLYVREKKQPKEFRFLSIVSVMLVAAGVAAAFFVPSELVASRFSEIVEFRLFPERFLNIRDTLNGIALRVLTAHPWMGSGIGSFPLDVRFFATDADWGVLRPGMACVPNGWMQLLVERGIVGAAVVLLPVIWLTVAYVRQVAVWARCRSVVHPSCWFPIVLFAAVVPIGFVDCSILSAHMMIFTVTVLAVSASSFSFGTSGNKG